MNPIATVMLWFLFPLWLLAGIADYLCHRRTSLERTSGLGESRLHILQAIEVGVPLVAGLLLEINALVLAIMILCVIAHTGTALWDGMYTTPRRFISPLEQHIHSHLEYIPIAALALVAILYWNQFLALFGAGPEEPSWTLRLKSQPLPSQYVLGVLLPVLLVQGGLLLEELLRALRSATARGNS
jgi:hypothetical protein